PKFTTKPSLRQDGKSIVFNCQLEGSPKPEIAWFRGDTALEIGSHFVASITDVKANTYDVKLEVKQASADDSGTYRAEATNKHGKTAANINLNLQGMVGAPSFIQKPAIKQADGGKKVIFECKIKADPKPFLTWFRDDIQLSDGGRYKYVEKEESAGQYYVALELSDPQGVDAATYKLNARNEHGESNANLKLNFDAKPTGGSAPKFTAKPVIRQVPNGVVFEVRLTADPAPSVAWSKGDAAISDGGRFTMTTQTDGLSWTLLLQISGVTTEDGGSYKVNAKNKHGESNANINLNLEAIQMPKFVGAPSISQQGSLTIMLVTVESASEPKATWMKGSSQVSSSGRISMSMKKVTTSQFGFSCEIKDAAAEDGGTYKCIVKNEGGEAVANI
ncbi:hypothetical protein CAPTEDRAFT_62162, partial [Capitella teleta]